MPSKPYYTHGELRYWWRTGELPSSAHKRNGTKPTNGQGQVVRGGKRLSRIR